jgi:hypothetical protein
VGGGVEEVERKRIHPTSMGKWCSPLLSMPAGSTSIPPPAAHFPHRVFFCSAQSDLTILLYIE